MNPDLFMQRVMEGAVLGPTDKNYKVYIDGYNKFYFEHMTQIQKLAFTKLLNDGLLKISNPGYFYKLPYFVTRKK
jgi:hypothetical protein